MRDGVLVEKAHLHAGPFKAVGVSMPAVSKFETMESPVTGQDISSWRMRDRDMDAAGAVDPRDLPRRPFEERREANERSKHQPPEWGGIPDA